MTVFSTVGGAGGGQGVVWRGAWASGQNYAVLDACSDAGHSYICELAINNSTTIPGNDPTHFDLMADQGDQGPQGQQGTTGNTGAQGSTGSTGAAGSNGTSVVWRGEWTSGQNYAALDACFYAAHCYICKLAINNSVVAPVSDPTHFDLMVDQGDVGPQGEQGIQGVQGYQGPQGPPGEGTVDETARGMAADAQGTAATAWEMAGNAGNMAYAAAGAAEAAQMTAENADAKAEGRMFWCGTWANPPGTNHEGDMYRNSQDGHLYFYDGVEWQLITS